MRRRGLPSAEVLDPGAPTPCFCPSCMAAGGAARERLRAKWFGGARALLLRNDAGYRGGKKGGRP